MFENDEEIKNMIKKNIKTEEGTVKIPKDIPLGHLIEIDMNNLEKLDNDAIEMLSSIARMVNLGTGQSCPVPNGRVKLDRALGVLRQDVIALNEIGDTIDRSKPDLDNIFYKVFVDFMDIIIENTQCNMNDVIAMFSGVVSALALGFMKHEALDGLHGKEKENKRDELIDALIATSSSEIDLIGGIYEARANSILSTVNDEALLLHIFTTVLMAISNKEVRRENE